MLPINRDPAALSPTFASRVDAALRAARAAGLDVYMFEGLRAAERQAQLYAQGRTTKGTIVTRSQPWQSWHQFGLAVDLAFGGPGRWHWNGDFVAVGAFFAAQRMRTLAPFETGHWEETTALSLKAARGLVDTAGLRSVWQWVDDSYTLGSRTT